MRKSRIQSISLVETPASARASEPISARSNHGERGGKVSHDSRGTAIWNWDVATGVLAASKSGDLLQMLENPALELEANCAQNPDWSGDPYNRR
jgi:hypothetical protein